MEARILIVDDHEIVRKGIRDIIRESRPEWEICGEASSGAEAIELGKALKPDVAILDISMPGMSGVEAASQIAGLEGRCCVSCSQCTNRKILPRWRAGPRRKDTSLSRKPRTT